MNCEIIQLSDTSPAVGVPPGYRNLGGSNISFKWRGKDYYIEVMTQACHLEACHLEEHYEEEDCPCHGRLGPFFWKEDYEDEDDCEDKGCYSMIVDEEELSYEIIEKAIGFFLICQGANIEDIKFEWENRDQEKDMAVWQEWFKEFIQWLKEGAPPHAIGIMPDCLDDITSFLEEPQEVVKQSFLDNGHVEDGDILIRHPEQVPKLPQEIFEQRLLEIAEKEGESDGVYLSPASWPPIDIVADGKCYRFSIGAAIRAGGIFERVWVGYLRSKKLVVVLSLSREPEIISVQGDPDVLAAMIDIAEINKNSNI